jgi:mannose-1-phosphate guanylyltransferase
MAKRYAVIMAGGSGTRLWPMSRATRPKQLLPLCPDGRSLLRESVRRLSGLFAYEDIFIIAAKHHLKPIAEDLKELPKENLIGEPVGRDTANAVGLSAAILAARDPEATMGIFTADHLIEPIETFEAAMGLAYEMAEKHPEYLCTFGIKPTSPHTGLGYVHRGQAMEGSSAGTYKVQGFKEKPDLATAQQYLASGEYYWNSGMFVWKVSTILDQLKQHLPQNTGLLIELGKSYGQAGWDTKAAEIYPQLQKISIDFAVMEKAPKVMVVELACRWADVGSWPELEKVTGLDESGNAILSNLVGMMESKNNVIVSSEADHLVTLIGVEDMIVVHTPDATLVCSKSQAQKIKDMVAMVESQFGKNLV